MEKDVNLDFIRKGNEAGLGSGINQGEVLIDFADAIVGMDAGKITRAREAVIAALGEPAMVDAAGVASNFQRMVRIADSTGIPLGGFEDVTVDIRKELGLEDYKK